MKNITLKWEKDSAPEHPESEVSCDALDAKSLMLYAAAKGAGMTVASLLTKMGIGYRSVTVSIAGELSQTQYASQSVYTAIDYKFSVECEDPRDHATVSTAVQLVHDKYCGLVRMMKMIAPVTVEVYIHTPQMEPALD